MISQKREAYRIQIRRNTQESEFAKKRQINPNNIQTITLIQLNQLQLKLQNFEYCDELLQQFTEYQQAAELIAQDLIVYLSKVQSIKTIYIGLQCLNNQLYYNSKIQCYELLQKWFQIQDNLIKQRCLQCLGNLAYDNPGLVDQISIDFLDEFDETFCEAYSFLIQILAERCDFNHLIRPLQILEKILFCNPNQDTYDALTAIFHNCSPLEVDDLIMIDYMKPIIRLVKNAQIHFEACEPLFMLIRKAKESTIHVLYNFGFQTLIRNYMQGTNPQLGLKLIGEFIHEDGNNDIVNVIFNIFDDDWLYKYLLQDLTSIKLMIICYSIQQGNTFIKFIQEDIIDKVFVPVLMNSDKSHQLIVLETICSILQKDELSLQQFRWIILQFAREHFLNSFRIDVDEEVFELQERIRNIIEECL